MFLLDRGASADERLLYGMSQTMIHRGPDDDGVYCDGPVGLAMRRLSIIDLDTGRQPVANEDETVRIVFNGEIYNYRELKADLVARGHRFRTESDTEVIVHLYEEHGIECVSHLNGMFAFALWDSRKSRLFLARDRLGIKPLFYSFDAGKRLLFGSEIKAILAAGADRVPDYQALYDYLSLMYVPTPATCYASIRKLPPGCVLLCTPDGMDIRQYWDIPIPDRGDELPVDGDYSDEIVDLIQTAVRRQMIADVPIGALLSGGLDSTAVSAVMAKKLNAPLKTFTVGFDRKSYDERDDARFVADTLGTEHRDRLVHPGMIDSVSDLVRQFDEPFADYSAIPTYLVSKLATEHVKVVLTGDGGDEVFAGYPTHAAYKVADAYRRVPGLVRNRVIAPLVMALPTSMERISFDYKAKRFVTGVDLPMDRGHYWWKVIFNEAEKQELCSGDFLSRGLRDSFDVFRTYFKTAERADPLNQLLYVDAKTFLLDDNLTKVDRMTMACSLEARVPLLDHELVERVAMIHPRVKLKGLQTKSLLRSAMKKLLPPRIRKGKKRGFTPPLPFWIRHELHDFVQDTLSEKSIERTGLLNAAYCRRILDEHIQGTRDNNRQIWTILALVCTLNDGA